MPVVDSQRSRNKEMPEQFVDLPLFVQRAIKLLRTSRWTAIVGVGFHDANYCPIAVVYHVDVDTNLWKELRIEVRRLLRGHGWTPHVFDAFMVWYDDRNLARRKRAEDLLDWALRTDRYLG